MRKELGNLNGAPIREPKEGEEVVVLMDDFDPPTMSHVHAVETLVAAGHCPIILCPMPVNRTSVGAGPAVGDADIRAMASILCADLCSSKVQTWLCTVALDKGMRDPREVLKWLEENKKGVAFLPASVWPVDLIIERRFIQIVFGGYSTSSKFAEPIAARKYLAVPLDIRSRIAAGMDESRNIPAPVWAYIQKKRLYRELFRDCREKAT